MSLTHFPALVIFSFLVAVVFGLLGKDTPRERLVYGAKVWGSFVGTAVGVGWLMYILLH
jgi:uncharacterized membrane protein